MIQSDPFIPSSYFGNYFGDYFRNYFGDYSGDYFGTILGTILGIILGTILATILGTVCLLFNYIWELCLGNYLRAILTYDGNFIELCWELSFNYFGNCFEQFLDLSWEDNNYDGPGASIF